MKTRVSLCVRLALFATAVGGFAASVAVTTLIGTGTPGYDDSKVNNPYGMAMGPDAVHLETDVHATADNVWGFADGEWIPYLSIDYTLTKEGSDWRAAGHLLAMTAKDGPHYANNVQMDGPGKYTVTLRYASPETNGFLHHVDPETGVPGWWEPFTEQFTFAYPQK